MTTRALLRAGRLLALGLLVLLACSDQSPPLGPQPPRQVQLSLSARFSALTLADDARPVRRIRLNAVREGSGEVVGTLQQEVDPAAESWNLTVEVTLPEGQPVRVVVSVELLSLEGGTQRVEWSGIVGPISVSGGTQPVQAVELYRGPLENLKITGLSISLPSARLPEGTSAPLSASVQGEANPEAVQVFWGSLDPTVATITPNGKLTAQVQGQRAGRARLVAVAGQRADTTEIEITPQITSISITPEEVRLTTLGEALFTAQVLDRQGGVIEGAGVLWSLGDPGVAEPLGGGRFRALRNGTTSITATAEEAPEVSASAVLVVEVAVARIEVIPQSRRLTALGEQVLFAAQAYDAQENPVRGLSYRWSSSAPQVATVDSLTGLATAVGSGTATITASAGAASGSATLTVEQDDRTLPTVQITSPTPGAEFAPAETITFAGSAQDASGAPLTGTSLRWISSRQGEIGTGASFSRTLLSGLHEIRLEATDSQGLTGQATVTIRVLPASISSNITSETVLPYIGVPYTVSGNILVQALLTIEPGVELRFTSNSGMRVTGEGGLRAIGTPELPIRFTGTDETPGHWSSLTFDSNHAQNELAHVVVAYGGRANFSINANVTANLVVGAFGGSGQVRITHSILRHSSGAGLFLNGSGTSVSIEGFASNRFEGNQGVPVRLYSSQLDWLDTASVYSGAGAAANAQQYIDVQPSTIGSTQSWRNLDVPYRFTGNHFISDEAVIVTVQPGTTVEFAANAGLRVSNGGALRAVGTAAQKITFTGSEATAGHWSSLTFDSNHAQNELTHVVVAYGGRANFSINANITASVVLGAFGGSGLVRITNSTLMHSSGAGLYLNGTARSIEGFAQNRFEGNQGVPVRLYSTQLDWLDAATVYSGAGAVANLQQYIDVQPSTVGSTQSWRNLDVPYRFTGNHFISDQAVIVTVQPGATIRFAPNAGLRVSSGALRAVGTAAQKITFTGSADTTGHWSSLTFDSNHAENELTHVVVSYGGRANFSINANITANVVVGAFGGGGRVRITNSTLRHSSATGLYLNGTAMSIEGFAQNRFEGNQGVPVRLYSTQLDWLDAATVYSGAGAVANLQQYIDVQPSTIGSTQSWRNLDVPYRFTGNHFISDQAVRVTVQPGTTVQFAANAGLRVSNGALRAVGTAAQKITFTGSADTAGHWAGLTFDSNDEQNELTHVVVAHGGRANFSTNANLTANVVVGAFGNGGHLRITNSTLRDSSGWGVYLRAGTLDPPNPETAGDNVFLDNALGDVRLP